MSDKPSVPMSERPSVPQASILLEDGRTVTFWWPEDPKEDPKEDALKPTVESHPENKSDV